MKRFIRSKEDILCMSDVRGMRIKVEPNVDFSFYYSRRNDSHGPRVKVMMDPKKVNITKAFNLRLVRDWKATINKGIGHIPNKKLEEVRKFFRKYLVLVLLIWDGHSNDEASLRDYLEGMISINEFIQELDFYQDFKDELDRIHNVQELESVCRSLGVVNFYGN